MTTLKTLTIALVCGTAQAGYSISSMACAAHIPERIIGAGVMAGDCEYAEEGAPQLGQFPEGSAFVFGRYVMCGPKPMTRA